MTALALVQARPEQVHTVIAHEPPLLEVLDDRDQLHAGTDEMIATYLSGDTIGAWSSFMAQANIELPPGALEMMFGGDREPQQLADERYFFTRELRPTTRWQPDVTSLRTLPTRVMIGIGEDSTDELCDRTSRALAAQLDIEPTMFPGGHTGFVDDPNTFAARMRDVLGEAGYGRARRVTRALTADAATWVSRRRCRTRCRRDR